MNLSNLKLYIIFNVVSLLVALSLNYLSISIPLNAKTIQELSDLYPNYFVPAGFTFSIWGIIYLLMIAFIGYQLYQFHKKRKVTFEVIITIGPWFLVSGLANATWILLWHYEWVFASVSVMLILLGALIKIYTSLKGLMPLPKNEIIFVQTYFSVYLGWISVATIANVTTAFVSVGWQGGDIGQGNWTCIMIVVATLLGVLFIYKNKDIPFAAVIIWALYGMYNKQSPSSEDISQTVSIFAKYGGTLLFIYAVLSIIGKKTYYKSLQDG